jgi:biopolymer transport protein ExbB/TolQ
MGPALLALADNNTATVGQSMVVAFSGVTLALIAASLSFWILNIRRRWLFEELRVIEIEQGIPVNGAT